MGIWRYISFLLVSAALPVFSQTDAKLSAAGADEIAEHSGLHEMVDSTADLTAAGMKKYSGRLKGEYAERYSKAIESAYAKDRIFPVFRKSFSEKLNPQDLPDIRKWLSSPLGMKITGIEKRALAPEAGKGFEEFVPKALSLDEKRKELVREFLKETSSEEMSAKIMCEPLRAMMRSLRETLPENMRADETKFMGDLDMLEQESLVRYRTLLPVSVAYTYRDLSDEEFSRMLDFYSTTAGKNFNSAILESLVSALYSAGEECGRGMAGILIDANRKAGPSSNEPVNQRTGDVERRQSAEP